MIVYFNGRFLPKEEVWISPDDRGFLFADGVYEVMHSYRGRLFRMADHLQRLERSLREIRIHFPDLEKLGPVAESLIRSNRLENEEAVVYIQVTRGAAPRRHFFPDEGTAPTVYASASSMQFSREKMEKGVKVILIPDLRWARCDIKSVGLLPNVLASQQAREQGAEEAIFVRDSIIIEGSHTSFCSIFDGVLVTHPLNQYILPGVTRGIVLDLCRQLPIPFKESPFEAKNLPEASEMFIMSTNSEITPVVQVDDWQVGDGKPGPLTRKLQQAYRDFVASDLNSR